MFRYVRSLVVLGIMVIGLLVSSSSALAGKVHVFASTFGAEGSGPGQFKGPAGVAVNEVTLGSTGNVYVIDEGNNRVEIFSSEGKTPVGEFNGGKTPAGSFSAPNAIAIDNSTSEPLADPSAGDVYVVDAGHNVLDKFDPEGNYLGQITTGAGGEPLGEIDGVAVDVAGVVWVYQASREIDSYTSALINGFVTSVASPFGTSLGFAVDPADDLYVNRGLLKFAKLSSAGGVLDEAVNPESNATAATVDAPTSDVYVDEESTIGVYGSGASLLERFGEGHLSQSQGVAVDSQNGLVYASNHEADTVSVFETVHIPTVLTGEGMSLSESTATLNGTVDPEGVEVSSCTFEYGRTREYGETAACSPAPGSGAGPVAVSAAIGGLELARYHFRITAVNANGETHSPDHTFVIASKPTLSSETLQGVSANTATVSARINPNGLSTSYQVEYGTSTSYGSSSLQAGLPAAFTPAGIQVTLSGLSQGTTYHARVIASNEQGGAQGVKDISFTTPTAGGTASASSCPNRTFSGFSPALPDCRAYEFVSEKGGPGEVYVPSAPETLRAHAGDVFTELATRAAAGGGDVTYVGESGEEGGTGATGLGLGDQFLATRTVEGWGVQNITPSIADPEVIPQSPIYEGYSSDLETEVFASDSPTLSANATPPGPSGCEVLYNRSADGAFHALFTKTLTPGQCGESISSLGFSPQNLLFAGANAGTATVAAGSHLLFQSPAPLTVGALSAEEGNGNNLYESIGATARLVSVLPGGEVDANAVFGGVAAAISRPDFAHAISADGSRVFWTDLGSGKIYERVNGTSTVEVSEGQAIYWDASSDGRFVLYTEGGQLWRFDTGADTREALTGAGAGVQGVAAISDDGSYVYFVAEGALASGAEVRKCREANLEKIEKRENGDLTEEEEERLNAEEVQERKGHLPPERGCNLYLEHAGTTSVLAVLSAVDDLLRRSRGGTETQIGDWRGDLGARTAQVADGGRELVFESTQQLTGYDNTSLDEEDSLEHGLEVFVFQSGVGLSCASCDPSGAPPAPEPEGSGTSLPVSLSPTFMRRWVSADGSRVFFVSSQPLVIQDTNQRQDVYEWERIGSGSCVTGSASGGCLSVLSGGDSSDLSYFIDASIDGSDVFFTHRGLLGGIGSSDGHVGLFDVRADGGFPETSIACTGTGCQGVPPASPGFATPPSATFSGGDNFPAVGKSTPSARKLTRAQLLAKALTACKQRRAMSRRMTCERQVRKRYGLVQVKGKKKDKKASKRSSKGRKS